ncbi:hypothetical protein AHAS_Ahas10G0128400 [Arachis hypogaea]
MLRRGRRGVDPIDDLTRDANAFIATINTMAEAVCETVTTIIRAIDCLGERSGDRNGRRNGERSGNCNEKRWWLLKLITGFVVSKSRCKHNMFQKDNM